MSETTAEKPAKRDPVAEAAVDAERRATRAERERCLWVIAEFPYANQGELRLLNDLYDAIREPKA